MAVAVRFMFLAVSAASVLSIGCSNSTESPGGPNNGLDGQMNSGSSSTTGGQGAVTDMTASAAVTGSCATAGSWRARNDLTFDEVPGSGEFATTVNALVHASTDSPISVSNHQDVHCTWMVAFSAAEGVGSQGSSHASTFTTMFQQGNGFWTTAPQTSGWVRLVGSDAQPIWIPIANITGSASYGGGCSSVSSAEVSGQIPFSAGSLEIATPKGPTTLGQLLGAQPAQTQAGAAADVGWSVHFTFSADLSR